MANPEIDILFKIRSLHKAGELGKLMTVIGQTGGLIGDIKTLSVGKSHSIREITISVFDDVHLKKIENAIHKETSAEVLSTRDLVFEWHIGGKIRSVRKRNIDTPADLRYIYTPGVARVCMSIKSNPELAYKYTNIANSVGIFTNGTRILGLGNIGPVAGMPVMEGKAVIYDQFVGISAIPILIDSTDKDEFVNTVVQIANTFGGIHLEDISTPDCFYIEDELIKRLNKPVMHDDQHGTATVTLAAVINALKDTAQNKDKKVKVAQIGLGAAGMGIACLLLQYGLDVIGVDLNNDAIERLKKYGGRSANLTEAIAEADVVIATTGRPGLIKPEMIKQGQIVLALSNPIPEIAPDDALKAGAALAADGQSINNALAYPGIFRAALDVKADSITPSMKIAAAKAIASLAEVGELVPSIFNEKVHESVISAVIEAYNLENKKSNFKINSAI